ncbi:MAG TPA: DUF2283 domain-containing protein, partial [Candidatus Paceibacterota bacterium]|nr:DUF2283 domain-containing protein [Candidatus Paceibacterota bacterium]
MKVLYDPEGDALYIPLGGRRTKVHRSICVDERRVVDIGAGGEALGIEILGASKGVRLADLVGRFDLQM